MNRLREKTSPPGRCFFRGSEARCWGAVEIGTSKIVVLAAEIVNGRINIVGAGEARSSGVRGGVVTDCAAAAGALGRALAEAERVSDLRLRRIFLSLSGAHVEGDTHTGVTLASGRDGRVTAADWENARELARTRELPPERCVLHHLPGVAELDGVRIDEPVAGRKGDCLRVRAWRMHARTARVADSLSQALSFGLEPAQVVFAGLASTRAVTTREERAPGVLVIDLGAGTTDYALYRDGIPINAGVLAVGGGHLDNDLAVGLRLRLDEAEAIKRRHGRASVRTRPEVRERVWLDDNRGVGARTLSLTAIEQITAARARETLEIVRRKLGEDYRPEAARAGVVLTGGGAELAGLTELAAEVFGVRARLGVPGEEIGAMLRTPAHATVLGALAAGWELETQTPPVRRVGFWRRMLRATDYVLRAGELEEAAGRRF